MKGWFKFTSLKESLGGFQNNLKIHTFLCIDLYSLTSCH
jgi:hypothetical protein